MGNGRKKKEGARSTSVEVAQDQPTQKKGCGCSSGRKTEKGYSKSNGQRLVFASNFTPISQVKCFKI